jgi:hypothetical protein
MNARKGQSSDLATPGTHASKTARNQCSTLEATRAGTSEDLLQLLSAVESEASAMQAEYIKENSRLRQQLASTRQHLRSSLALIEKTCTAVFRVVSWHPERTENASKHTEVGQGSMARRSEEILAVQQTVAERTLVLFKSKLLLMTSARIGLGLRQKNRPKTELSMRLKNL